MRFSSRLRHNHCPLHAESPLCRTVERDGPADHRISDPQPPTSPRWRPSAAMHLQALLPLVAPEPAATAVRAAAQLHSRTELLMSTRNRGNPVKFTGEARARGR